MRNKFSFLCILLSFSLLAQAKSAINLYQKLVEVNSQWQFQADIPQNVLNESASLTETEAIQLHLQLVEQTLRQRDVSTLTKQQQNNRIAALNELNTYWKKGIFPKNEYLSYRNPVFIDKYNTFCAVGYLVKATGNEAVSREIAATQNFAYVYEIQSEKLLTWANTYGFTLAELAWIQPGYPANMPTQPMKNGVGGTVYDMMMGTMGTDLIHVAGQFPNGVSTYISGFSGYDWFPPVNVTGGAVYALAYWNNMPVYGGNFTEINGMPVSNIAQFSITGQGFSPMGTLTGVVKDLLVYNNNLYAAGSFGLAVWNGSDWQNLTTTDGIINCLYEWNSDLYMGGNFTKLGSQSISYIAKFNAGTISAVGNSVHYPVNALSNYQDTLYIGTDFHTPFDTASWGFVYRWDNTNLDSISLMMKGHGIYAFADGGMKLYVGGDFNEGGGIVMTYGQNLATLEKYGNVHAVQMLDILNAPVYALKADNNMIYVGGAFTANLMVNNFGGVGNFNYLSTDIPKPHQDAFTVSPNPTQDYIEISGLAQLPPQTPILLRDITGKVLQSFISTEQSTKINMQNLPSGIYLIQVENQIQRIVKQ